MRKITENGLEEACLSWLSELGWSILHGPDIAPNMPDTEREDYKQVFLMGRLRDALIRINPNVSEIGIEEAIRKIAISISPDPIVNNRHYKPGGLVVDYLGLADSSKRALADYTASARKVMGDDKLKFLAQELILKVKQSVSIDRTLREKARAQIRVMVKRMLRKYGYPPDMEKKATELLIEQAELLCKEWTH